MNAVAPDPWLSPAAVVRLTGRVKASAQRRRLCAMGIAFLLSATGWPLVESGLVLTEQPLRVHRLPNWRKVKRGKAAQAQQASPAAHDDAARGVLPHNLR